MVRDRVSCWDGGAILEPATRRLSYLLLSWPGTGHSCFPRMSLNREARLLGNVGGVKEARAGS